jgi:hypothetical protein
MRCHAHVFMGMFWRSFDQRHAREDVGMAPLQLGFNSKKTAIPVNLKVSCIHHSHPAPRVDISFMSGPDYIVDIGGLAKPGGDSGQSGGKSLRGRPWLAVSWRCCGVYSRVYRNTEGTAYEGRCPRCGKLVHVGVGPEGTSHRFFEAS